MVKTKTLFTPKKMTTAIADDENIRDKYMNDSSKSIENNLCVKVFKTIQTSNKTFN